MSKKLPHDSFEWINDGEITSSDILKYDDSLDYGMILEVWK